MQAEHTNGDAAGEWERYKKQFEQTFLDAVRRACEMKGKEMPAPPQQDDDDADSDSEKTH
jgi:hypothetical protein